MRRSLVLVGKAPLPGAAKTRLGPPVAAAALYRAFLLDTLDLARQLGWQRTTIVHPRGDDAELRSLCEGVQLLEQNTSGLEDALKCAFTCHFREGFERVVLIGSDSPTLPVDVIVEAEAALADHDVVLGPTRDGGYYLIGMRQPHLGLFEDVDWSTSRVFAQTLRKAQRLGLQVHEVGEWYDVDEPADLDRLRDELTRLPESVAPNTRATLRGWDEDRRRLAGASRVLGRDALGHLSAASRLRQNHD